MTDKEYRAYPAINKSSLFHLMESPEKFKWYIDNPEPPTPALLFGQFFHGLVLQGDNVWNDFALQPNVDRRTKEGRAEYNSFMENLGKRAPITVDMFEEAENMYNKLCKNDFVVQLLNGEHELPFFWKDDLTGEDCKCRVDCITKIGDLPIVVDLKSTNDASTDGFIRSAIKYGYDVQAAMYLEGVKKNTGVEHGFVFIAIEKNPPYSINILQADKLLLRRGYDIFRELIGLYHDCKVNDKWFGYEGKFNVINTLSLPAYLAKEVE